MRASPLLCNSVTLRPHHRRSLSRVVRTALVACCACIAPAPDSPAAPASRELPDTQTWTFFSEKKLRSRLFYSVPGVGDSLRVSDDPACCPTVSPSGQWAACTVFNSKAIESELVLLTRQSEQWRPLPGYTVISYQWAPDGLSLAGYGKRRTAASVCFFAVQAQSRTAWFADSILVPEDYDFAWDPTSSRVAICRPGHGAHDPPLLRILSLADRKTSTLATLRTGELTNPRWLPDGTLLVSKRLGAAGDSAVDLRFPTPGR